jgi:hypothetical protein
VRGFRCMFIFVSKHCFDFKILTKKILNNW